MDFNATDLDFNATDYENLFTTSDPSTPPTSTEPKPWFQVVIEIFQAYINPVFSVTGILSNILSVAVFTWNRAIDKSGTVQYLTCLALVDIWNSFYFGILTWLENGLRIITHGEHVIDLPVSSPVACKLLRFSSHVSMMMSGWILVFFSAERCIAVFFPLRLASIVTDRGRKLAILVLFILIVLWQSKTLVYYDVYVSRTVNQCFWAPHVPKIDKLAITIANLSTNLKLPCLLITILNTSICVALVRKRRNREKLQVNQVSTKELKAMLNLVFVSVMYVLTNTPSAIIWSYYNYVDLINTQSNAHIEIDFVSIFRWANLCDSLLVINFSMNFAIYVISLDFYRATIKLWLRRCASKGPAKQRSEKSSISFVSTPMPTRSSQNNAYTPN